VRGIRLAAIVVIACTATACSKSEPAAQPTSTQRQGASDKRVIPVIEKLQVSMLGKPVSGANARLFATVSPDSVDVIAQGYFELDRGNRDKLPPVLMTDDGNGADDQAGDLVFSGFLTFDFDELRRQNRRVKELGGPGRVKVVRFDRRQSVGSEAAPIVDETAIVPENPIDVEPLGLAAAIAMDHSLVINHVDVVTDPGRTFDRCNGKGTPMGPWTFGHLFQEMVNPALTGNDPQDVAEKWLGSWNSNQELHFNSAVPRPNVQQFIDDWRNASGTGRLEMQDAPFRLVAIVNRMDLHEAIGYGGGSGETRFVFALEDSNCYPLPFLVIFEYGNIREDCDAMTDLARLWVELGNLTVGSPDYNELLQKITDEVVTANAAPSKPNGSALNQLRTNDFVFDGPWQLREFVLHPKYGYLVPDTVKRTPDISLDSTPDLDLAIDDNLPTVWPNPPFSMINILTGSFDPIEYPAGSGVFIRAMASDIPHTGFCFQAKLAGNAAISGPDARFEYSSNTCSGCHGGDVNASGNFTHIDENGNLSPFLSGPHSESDCMTGTPRNFDEPTRRAQILDALANNACERLAMLKELHAEH